ncbi:MAG: CRTAC1 family protein [Edaphobacter sp.]
MPARHRSRRGSPSSIFALCAVLFIGASAIGQSPAPASPATVTQPDNPQQTMQPAGMGGVNTGGAHAAVLDSEHRPITAGGFVKSGPIIFQDIAQKAGLTAWTHTMGTPDKNFIIETVGSGVGLFDYDTDGWLDIYLVNGSTYDAMSGKTTPPHAALFHNNHDGTFTDVAEKAGVTLGNWSTGATWGDYDGDGRLDLFVPGYVHYDIANQPGKGGKEGDYSFCQFRGETVMCGPRGLIGETDHLFHNTGDGTFTDVSEKAGVSDKNGYYGLASAFVDVNNDGKPDLLVADDSSPNYLYINKGDGTFEDDSYVSGYALNENGRETASMGIAIGDYRNNGLLDLYNTTFSDDYNPLYRNDGDANFTDISYQMGIAEPTIPFLGWGTAFLDFDNDGWKDLMVANGHVYPQVDHTAWGTTWKQRPLLFHNIDGKKFDVEPAVEGTALANLYVGRGMAVGDLFNDGKLDVVINALDSHPGLLRNVSADHHHWIELKLIGGPKSPRDATGATVYLTANGMRQREDAFSGGSFASTRDPRLHFGLGDSTTIGPIEIHWPSGAKEKFTVTKVDQIVTLTEGNGIKM